MNQLLLLLLFRGGLSKCISHCFELLLDWKRLSLPTDVKVWLSFLQFCLEDAHSTRVHNQPFPSKSQLVPASSLELSLSPVTFSPLILSVFPAVMSSSLAILHTPVQSSRSGSGVIMVKDFLLNWCRDIKYLTFFYSQLHGRWGRFSLVEEKLHTSPLLD